jgi:hypothetical protein
MGKRVNSGTKQPDTTFDVYLVRSESCCIPSSNRAVSGSCGIKVKKVKVAGGVLWYFSHLGFLYPDPKGVPSFISRGAARRTTAAPLLAKEGTMNGNFACYPVIHINCKVLLHAAKLGHGTDSFTSPPKEGMLMIFNTR